MTGRERLKATLNHKQADRVPLDLGTTNSTSISVTAYKRLLKYLGKPDDNVRVGNIMQQLAVVDEDILEFLDVDTRGLSPSAVNVQDVFICENGDKSYTDEWGIVWRMTNGGFYFDMLKNPLAGAETATEVETFRWPELDLEKRAKGLCERARYIAENGKAILLKGFVPGLMEFALWLRGYEEFLMDLYLNKPVAEAILEKSLEVKTKYWEHVLQKLGDMVDVVNESDDLGTQIAPIISLSTYKEFIKPRHRKITDTIRKNSNAKIFLHSCGAVKEFIPDLIDAGFEILNPVQYTAAGMDAAKLKKEFGDKISFWGGGVDTQNTLPFGTPQQVRDEVKRNIDILAPGGGYVFAQIHNIQGDVPPENIMAMYETYFDNCKY